MSTYTQIHIQIVFSVQNRERLIDESWREQLNKYITAILQKHGHKLLAIGGTDDHIHILIGYRPTHALSDLVAEVKRDSSKWINQNRFVEGKFVWQEGYAAFSYGKTLIPKVITYIENQEKHHKTHSYAEEIKKFLDVFGVEYKEQYLI